MRGSKMARPRATRHGIGRLTAITCWTGWHRLVRSSRRSGGPAEYTYDYAIIRVVPRVERGESINVGVILSCPDVAFLEARIELDAPRLLALDATLDVEATRANLDSIPVVCRGGA